MNDPKKTTAPIGQGPARRGFGGSRPGGRPEGGRRTFADRPKEFDPKMLEVRRVTRVVAGGRRMSFAVSMIIGDKKGMVGVGTGKGNDTSLAINKALKSAKKNSIKLKLNESGSIPHEIRAKYCSSTVTIFPNRGRGLVSGAAVRSILELAGVKDVTSKVLSGSKNKLNTARAAIKALSFIATKYAPVAKIQEEIEVAPPKVAPEIAPIVEE